MITQQLKAIENPNNVDIKSIIIEHPKTSHKLSKTIRQTDKVSQVGFHKISNTPLYSKTKKREHFLKNENKIKKNKRMTCF